MTKNAMWLLSIAGLVLAATGCKEDGTDSGADAGLDLSVCDPASGSFTADVDNPYFPLPLDLSNAIEGEEDGALVRVEFTVLADPETVAGVPTRVFVERESQDGILVEVSRNFFTQAADGTVCYF